MTKTLSNPACHAHPDAKGHTKCVECGQRACQRRCFLNGRTKYCKPCRNKLKKEAERDQENTEDTIDKVELALDVADWASDAFPIVSAVIIIASCGALLLGLKAVSVIFGGF
ncbi:MAG: hypothetical protein P1V97_06135 [Planctomycetota bacterium]|nr:hypothetical protein [Planctomycetota bacterium]